MGTHFVDNGNQGYRSRPTGQPRLTQIIERTGESIVIASDHISNLDTNGVETRRITIQRNINGQIIAISDPSGLTNNVAAGPPAVQYQYDQNHNLINVLNLVNRAGTGTYTTNTFAYTNTSFPHFITGIFNANGTQVANLSR